MNEHVKEFDGMEAGFYIRLDNIKQPATRHGLVKWPFAVHQSKTRRWVITHLPTGLFLVQNLKNKEHAIYVIDVLKKAYDESKLELLHQIDVDEYVKFSKKLRSLVT